MQTAKVIYSSELDSYLAVYHVPLGNNNFQVWLAESKDLKNWDAKIMLAGSSSSQPYIANIEGKYYVSFEKSDGQTSNIVMMRFPDVNSLLSKIKTRDLVILDEPTDGFSEQQLDKMRDVLQELNVAQLIIVSHEQKMEGFVENVIRFRKDGGVSRREE